MSHWVLTRHVFIAQWGPLCVRAGTAALSAGGPSEVQLNCVDDMGLQASDVAALVAAWKTLMNDVYRWWRWRPA